ncbi:MAG: hypothetical protein DRQ39_10815 [Gammaproteobacteria bacterium]|nr:MAG: hypothetical protein DRQ39_10815 [Gammaproteobacteria bacterium]
MPNFETVPTISFKAVKDLLEDINNTFNINGRTNTFQLSRIASGGIGNALFTALRSTKSHDGFQANLMKQCKAMNGIARTFNFELDAKWNIDREYDKFFESKVPSLDSKMRAIFLRRAKHYGYAGKVTIKNMNDILDEMDFADVSELDEADNDRKYKEAVRSYIKAHRDALKEEYPEASLTDLKQIVADDILDKPEPVRGYVRLKQDAETVIAKSRELTRETWEAVKQVLEIPYPEADINALDSVDGYDGEDRYRLVQAILRNFDWAQQDSNDKLEEIVMNPEMENMEGIHESNLAGAMVIIPICNELIAEAEQVFQSNTSEEISRELDEGTSDNLAGDNAHDYEVSENIPHGSMG